MNAKATKTAGKLTPCACRSFEFGDFDGENEAAISYDTNCQEQTKRTFAMGHDAKLVGFLVRAELAGEEIRMVEGGMATTFPGAVEAAGKVSDALAAKAQYQIDAARARVSKKAAREATKKARVSKKAAIQAEAPAAPAKPAPTTREATIKVGRWTYPATIEIATGVATYKPRFGDAREMDLGRYTEVK